MKKILLLIGGLVLILIIVRILQDDGKLKKSTPSEYSVLATAEEFVKQNLKSPSTAEFSSFNESKINIFEDQECWVSGFVDAQNSFGAMIRNNYVVKMRYNNDNTFTLIDIDLK